MEILIDFMERHQDLARNTSDDDENLWKVITITLNNTGGANKLPKLWKRVLFLFYLFIYLLYIYIMVMYFISELD